jgi:predicted Zn-dependent protease with MMP-like domain
MQSLRRFTTAPTLAELEAIAEKAAAGIPAELRSHVRNVLIRVEDFPDEETVQEMELESPFDLLGLYRGVGMPWQSVTQPRLEPDMIFLYRRPILDYWCETGEDLTHLVRHVLIHEIGHHFGFSDADMEALEAAAGVAGARD